MENGHGCVPMRNGNEEPCFVMNEEPCVVMRAAKGRKAKMLMAAAIATLGISGANAQMAYGSAGAVSSSVVSACVPTTVTITPSASTAADQTTADVDGVQGSETTSSHTVHTTKTAFVTISGTTTFVKATQPAENLTSTVTVYNSTTTLMATGMVGTGTGASSWAIGTGSFNTAANGTYAAPTATAGLPEQAGAATSSTVSYTHLALALIASAALGVVLGAEMAF